MLGGVGVGEVGHVGHPRPLAFAVEVPEAGSLVVGNVEEEDEPMHPYQVAVGPLADAS